MNIYKSEVAAKDGKTIGFQVVLVPEASVPGAPGAVGLLRFQDRAPVPVAVGGSTQVLDSVMELKTRIHGLLDSGRELNAALFDKTFIHAGNYEGHVARMLRAMEAGSDPVADEILAAVHGACSALKGKVGVDHRVEADDAGGSIHVFGLCVLLQRPDGTFCKVATPLLPADSSAMGAAELRGLVDRLGQALVGELDRSFPGWAGFEAAPPPFVPPAVLVQPHASPAPAAPKPESAPKPAAPKRALVTAFREEAIRQRPDLKGRLVVSARTLANNRSRIWFHLVERGTRGELRRSGRRIEAYVLSAAQASGVRRSGRLTDDMVRRVLLAAGRFPRQGVPDVPAVPAPAEVAERAVVVPPGLMARMRSALSARGGPFPAARIAARRAVKGGHLEVFVWVTGTKGSITRGPLAVEDAALTEGPGQSSFLRLFEEVLDSVEDELAQPPRPTLAQALRENPLRDLPATDPGFVETVDEPPGDAQDAPPATP